MAWHDSNGARAAYLYVFSLATDTDTWLVLDLYWSTHLFRLKIIIRTPSAFKRLSPVGSPPLIHLLASFNHWFFLLLSSFFHLFDNAGNPCGSFFFCICICVVLPFLFASSRLFYVSCLRAEDPPLLFVQSIYWFRLLSEIEATQSIILSSFLARAPAFVLYSRVGD